MFFRFLSWKTRFPHENIAISPSCFHGSHFSGLGSFWVTVGVSREPLWEPLGTHCAFGWVTLPLLGCLGSLLGSLVGPIWVSFGWLCAFLEALWRKSGHQLGDSVSLWVRFAFFWVSGLLIKFFALSLDATGCGYGWSRFRFMSVRKHWSPATHKTKCTHVRNLPVHVYMLIHYMTCALAATNYLKTIRFESDNGRFNKIWLQYIHSNALIPLIDGVYLQISPHNINQAWMFPSV